MNLPEKVTIVDVGPRDGFQSEKQFIPTEKKIEIVNGLIRAGLKHIQVSSVVHPKAVPQLPWTFSRASRCVPIAPCWPWRTST
jgi:isopropylmalate/homocitrate/citramalate synthase